MNKQFLLGTLAVFVIWSILDLIIHGAILAGAYAETAELWRPEGEMKMWLTYLVVLIAAGTFVYIYAELIGNKSVATALKYGLVFGIGAGISMGYGSYAVMPITYGTALTWFLGTIVEALAGAYVMAMIVKPDVPAAAAA